MRARFLILIFTFVWISLLSRVYYLSIHSNRHYAELSMRNTIHTEQIAPVRGDIVDRHQTPVAINKLGFRIELSPHLGIKQKQEHLDETLHKITQLLPDLNATTMRKKYLRSDSRYNHSPITVADFVSYETILPVYTHLVLTEDVRVTSAPQRYYPYGPIAAHLIGYAARANKQEIEADPILQLTGIAGKTGLEKYYNRFLEGTPGTRTVQMNALNEVITVLDTHPPVESRLLTLNVDMHLQAFIAGLMKGKSGAVIVMGLDGAILSMGSYPEYDPNVFVSGISTTEWNELINDPDTPFTDKAVRGLYPPGSTIKPSMGLVYLQNGLGVGKRYYCNGAMELGNRYFRCWKSAGHGHVDIVKAIRESCDDYFYEGSLKVGIAAMSSGLKALGMGRKTGIDQPNEFIGTIPDRNWKRRHYDEPWYIGETLNASIGQGNMLSTPLQIAQQTALIAGERLPVPRIAMQLEGNLTTPQYRDVLTPAQRHHLPLIRRAMEQVCNHGMGTAAAHITTRIRIAGKTGTAQVIGLSQATMRRIKEEDLAYYKRSHAWLTTYGPARHPRYVVTVLVEHGGHGGEAAGGIVSEIYDKLIALGYIPDPLGNAKISRF